VLRKTGVRYEMPFSACSQRSVMFLNPAQVRRQQHGEPERRNAAGGHTDEGQALSGRGVCRRIRTDAVAGLQEAL
jgi:hypothetical protein